MALEEDMRSLFRFEHYEPEDGATYVDWVWLTAEEFLDYKSTVEHLSVRIATEAESDLYNDAYADGYGVAALVEYEDKFDGVTFRVELNKDGELSNGAKMFQCAICDKHKDFEAEVGMVNGFFLTELKNEVLWHVCYQCAMLSIEVEGIAVELTEEGKADS